MESGEFVHLLVYSAIGDWENEEKVLTEGVSKVFKTENFCLYNISKSLSELNVSTATAIQKFRESKGKQKVVLAFHIGNSSHMEISVHDAKYASILGTFFSIESNNLTLIEKEKGINVSELWNGLKEKENESRVHYGGVSILVKTLQKINKETNFLILGIQANSPGFIEGGSDISLQDLILGDEDLFQVVIDDKIHCEGIAYKVSEKDTKNDHLKIFVKELTSRISKL